jgi:parallel beta-helix repeat protein
MNGTQSWKLIFPSDQEAIGLQNLANSTVSGNAISGGAPGGGISYWTNASTAGAVGNQFYNNYIHDILGFGIAPGGSGTSNSNVSVTYNIISRCGQGSSPPYGGLRLNRAQSGTSLIANNIVYGCDRGIYMYSLTDHYIIKNNIISGNSDYAVYRGEVGINSNILSSNIYYPDGSAEFYYMGSNENFSQWKNSTNQDSNSLSSNPLFTNASGSYSRASDFQLQSSSPAINAGTNIGLTSDYAGNPIVGSPDIGAYEYQGTIPSTPPSDTTPPAAPTGLSVN